MSLDRSLKVAAGMSGNRSVYTRAERIAKMKELSKPTAPKNQAIGLPKTRVTKG